MHYLLGDLALVIFFFNGLLQQSNSESSATTIPPNSSETDDKPHTSHTIESSLLTFLFVVFLFIEAVFPAILHPFSTQIRTTTYP